MFVTNWISTTKIQKISEITNFFRHYFLSRTEVIDWNFDNINDVFELVGSEQYKEVAKNGQELYLDYINGKKDEIVDHILYSIMN